MIQISLWFRTWKDWTLRKGGTGSWTNTSYLGRRWSMRLFVICFFILCILQRNLIFIMLISHLKVLTQPSWGHILRNSKRCLFISILEPLVSREIRSFILMISISWYNTWGWILIITTTIKKSVNRGQNISNQVSLSIQLNCRKVRVSHL